MQYLIGAVSATVLFLCIGLAFYLGRMTRPKPGEMPEDEKYRAERLQKELNEIINYNLSKALERRKP